MVQFEYDDLMCKYDYLTYKRVLMYNNCDEGGATVPQRRINEDISDRVEVEARGRNLEQLRAHATVQAAEFFGVDPEIVTLRMDSVVAKPHIVNEQNVTVMYRALITVRYSPFAPPEGTDPARPAVSGYSPGPLDDDDEDADDEAE